MNRIVRVMMLIAATVVVSGAGYCGPGDKNKKRKRGNSLFGMLFNKESKSDNTTNPLMEYLKKVRNVAFNFAMDSAKEDVKIVGAKLGNKAGYMGALTFAFDQLSRSLKR